MAAASDKGTIMLTQAHRPAPPTDDKRWKIVDATMRRQSYSPAALIETLHTAQESFGFLDDDALRYVAHSLTVPLGKVYGVATFYHYFQLKPKGKHSCVVCLGTACYMKGATDIVKMMADEAGIAPGETTPDGKVSLMVARCIGACSLAPGVVADGDVLPRPTLDDVRTLVKRWLSE